MTTTWFRHADPRFPFLWETTQQPAGRWNAAGDGPVTYLASTPDVAWAEFLRHEGITSTEDLAGIRRTIWALEVDDSDTEPMVDVAGTARFTRGGRANYAAAQRAAQSARDRGARSLRAPSAALVPGGARGQRTDGGLRESPDRDGVVLALFGPRPQLPAWVAAEASAPRPRVLRLVVPLT